MWNVSKYGVFSGPYSVRMRENTDQKKLRIWTLFTQCKLRTFWGSGVQEQKIKITMIYISFKKIYLQKNDLNTVKVIFCDVTLFSSRVVSRTH